MTCGFRAWLHTDESGNEETTSFKLLYNGTVVGMGDAQRLMFSTNFTFDPLRRPSSFNFTATYKDQKDCNSQLQVNRCEFHRATLFYPIKIVDGAIESSSSLEDLGRSPETIAVIYDTNEQGDITTKRTIGGLYLVANDLLKSKTVGMQIIMPGRWKHPVCSHKNISHGQTSLSAVKIRKIR